MVGIKVIFKHNKKRQRLLLLPSGLKGVNCRLKLRKGFFQRHFWAGDVKTFKALALRTKHGAAVQPQFGIIDDQVFQSIFRQAQFPEIQPYKIGSLWLNKFYFW